MTKRKKESQKENRAATKVSGGKITKAKHKETPMETPFTKKMQVRLVRTPLLQRQSTNLPHELISATHSLRKTAPKWTSTPLNTEAANNQEDKTFRLRRLIRKNLKYNTLAAPDRPPFSPIGNLINSSSNVGRDSNSIDVGENKNKENASPLPTKTGMNLRRSMRAEESAKRTRSESQNVPKSNMESTALKVSESDPIGKNPGRTTRRRSIGIPKVSKITKTNDLLEVPTKYKNNRCSDLRVRISRCSSVLNYVSSADKSLDAVIPKTNNRRKSALRDPKDNSFVQCLRDDWSTKSLNDTLSQVHQIRDKIIPLRADKRKLSPLIELSSYESSLSTLKPPRTTSANEDDYSSSAEFESSDEKENSRSKRAPTWKDLSNKSVRSASHTSNQISQNNLQNGHSMKVRLRKLRIHANKDTEVISENKNAVPSKNLEETVVTSKEVPSQEKDKQQADMNHQSEEPAATDYATSPSPKSRNLLNKSDLIEQILSSSADDDAQHISSSDKTNSNCTRKFFHSHRDQTMAVVPQTVEPLKTRRTSGRNKKRDSIYEFLSQSSSDSNDPVADIIQKMINNGKVVVAKHKKGTGKSVVPRRKRKVATKNKHPDVDDVFVKPHPPPSPDKAQTTPSVEADPIDNDLAFDEGSAPYVDEEPVRDQRGFSKLARSAMIKHAGKRDNISQRKMITDKQQLLALAQKFVGQSTPVRVPSQATSNVTAPFSPIPGGSSPWRVDDDKLPTTFYFDRNSDNLPSYSSDYIPSTPSKNKSKSTSSFSSNDSNGENVAPPSVTLAENRAQSNPRRALSYRSPLKAINILEVVNLPPLAVDRREKDAPKKNNNNNNNNNSNKFNNSAGNKSNANISNLFGFEEMIEDDEDDVDISHEVLNAGKINLKEQMQRLKRLRNELPKATTSRNNCIKPVFDNERQRQKTLQQMFSSTMIERQSMEPQNSTVKTNYFNGTGDGDLFKDPDPETTFDQSTARRSYSRPFKRKRKLRHNFVMFMDSDASEEEDDDVVAKNQQKKLKERNKKTPKENLELKKFVNDFNAMYKEVSEYELIVE